MIWTDKNIQTAAELSRSGLSYRDIAERFGVSRGSVAGLANRRRDLFPKAAARAKTEAKPVEAKKPKARAKNYADRFAWDDAKRQRAVSLWKSGKSYREIGDVLGCDRTTVGMLAKRRPDLFPKHEKPKPEPVRKFTKPTARMASFALSFRQKTASGTRRDLSVHAIEGVPSKRFVDVGAHECRFPLVAFDAADGLDVPCCAAETMPGQSWCAHHFRVVFPGRGR
ncbi:GcrA family cell cycle regulator [Martelella alba]|nr:GcrA family cell cycle regulator [Martelella alba]